MFITFNTKNQALNYIKRNKHLNYNHNEGCGCCYSYGSLFIDGNKLVKSYVTTHQGFTTASATIIGKIRSR